MATSYLLQDLPPGLYHLYPAAEDLASQLQGAIEAQGLACLLFPYNVADYLVADTVRREAAFDLENMGMTGDQLHLKVEAILHGSPFRDRARQAPATLSGGEQQLLAVTAALQQPQRFLIGHNCFDFISDRNLETVHANLVKAGKCMLEITCRNERADKETYAWRFDGQRLKAVPASRQNCQTPGRLAFIQPWRLTAKEVEKTYSGSPFTLKIPYLQLNEVRCLGIHGDNGSGKSTFADCLTGLTAYEGRLSLELAGVEEPKLGYLVQHVETPTHGLSAHEIVELFIRQGCITMRAGNHLETVLIESLAYRPLAGLDGRIGRRLVVVAALLAGDYDLVILDEPTYGLPTPAVVDFLAEAVEEFGAKPLVFLSHDYNFLTHFCDTIICLDQGAVNE